MTENYFVIDDKLPSLNEYQAACRRNKFAGAKFKADFEKLVTAYLMVARNKGTLRTPKSYPIEIYAEWHEKDKRRDVDNIKSAMKFILDAMTKSGVIPDDNRKFISQIHDTVIDEPLKKTFVKIILKEK